MLYKRRAPLCQRISPSLRPCEMSRNIVSVYSEESLALRPAPMLEAHVLKDGIGRLSRNVDKKLLILAVL